MAKKRTGAPISGTVAANGTDGSLTLPRIFTFARPVSPCIVTNHGLTDEILVKVNVETKDATAVSEVFSQAAGLGHIVIPPKATLADASKDPPEGGECYRDVSMGGLIAVHSVSVVTVNGDLDDVSVVGWDQ